MKCFVKDWKYRRVECSRTYAELQAGSQYNNEYLELGFRNLPRTWSKCWLSAQIFHVALHATYAADQIRAQCNKNHASPWFSSAQTL